MGFCFTREVEAQSPLGMVVGIQVKTGLDVSNPVYSEPEIVLLPRLNLQIIVCSGCAPLLLWAFGRPWPAFSSLELP